MRIMAGRLTLLAVAELQQRFGIEHDLTEDVLPRTDIAPPQSLLIVVEEPAGRCLRWVRWGFRPPWFALRPSEPSITCIRAETLPRQATSYQAVRQSRCLIPADGIWDWQRLPGQRLKQSVQVQLRGGGLFGIAGLYTEWLDERSGRRRASGAMVTTAANELLSPLNARMPAILQPEDEGQWLHCSPSSLAMALACLRPYPAAGLELVPAAEAGRNGAPGMLVPPTVSEGQASDAA